MAEGSILVLCVCLALGPPVVGDDIMMRIKSATGTDFLTVRFPESTFVKFYNSMCAGAYTEQIGNLKTTRSSTSVTGVFEEKRRKSEYISKYFICLHDATSETINCTMLFDHESAVSSEGSTESFRLLRDKGDCNCVGFRWNHPGETIFSADNETMLRLRKNNCTTIARRMKISTRQASTIVTSSHINTSDLAEENTAQDNNLLLIITVVVGSIILLITFVALLLFIRQRRHTMENYIPNSCIHDQTTNILVRDREPYLTPENVVSNNANRIVEENEFMIQNLNDFESAKFEKHRKHRMSADTDRGYVAMSGIDKTMQNGDEHYDTIVGDEKDGEDNVKVTDVSSADRLCVAPVRDVKNHKLQSSFLKDNLYEECNETVCRDRFPDATDGCERKHKVQDGCERKHKVQDGCERKHKVPDECERKHKVQDEIVYTSIQENYALQDTTNVLKEHTSDIRTPCTVNSYEDVSYDKTNQNYYGNIHMVNSDQSEHLGEDSNVRDDHVDANSEEHDHKGHLTNTPNVRDDAESAAFYSRLHTEVCKRANPYDILCESDEQQI